VSYFDMVFSILSIPFLALIGIILFMPERVNRRVIDIIKNPEKGLFEWWFFPLQDECYYLDFPWRCCKIYHENKYIFISHMDKWFYFK
jgi:hypothetical protein